MSIFGPDNVDSFIISGDLDVDGNRIIELRNPQDALDVINKRYLKRIGFKTKDLEDKLTALETKVAAFDGTKSFTSGLNMGNNRIINVAHPRNPEKYFEHGHDVATAKTMYDYIKRANGKFLTANENNVLDGRLNMQQHKIISLADPVNSYDAVNLRHVSSRIQALTDENAQLSNRIQALVNENYRLSNLIDQSFRLIASNSPPPALAARLETLERFANVPPYQGDDPDV